MDGVIFLAGGGGAEDSQILDRKFIELIGKSARILYIPQANQSQLNQHYVASLDWLQTTLQAAKNLFQIDLWSGQKTDLTPYQAIYIGGGNTYYLRYLLSQSGLDQAIVDYYRKGGVIYGGSAGAIILGKSLKTVISEATPNTPTIHQGLNLIQNHSIVCHFNKLSSTDKTHLAQLTDAIGSIIGLSEDTGIIFHNNNFEIIGINYVLLKIND